VAKDLIEKILIKRPEDRIGAQSIQDLMNHPFFEGINFDTISTELPPEDFKLNPQQETLKKFLPKYRPIK